jgi:flagellar basal body rod protein FlgB
MSLFDDKLSLLLNHRLTWLGARSNVIAQNIAHADIKKAPHKEMRSFGQVLKRHGAIPTKNGQQVRILRLGDSDIVYNKKKRLIESRKC